MKSAFRCGATVLALALAACGAPAVLPARAQSATQEGEFTGHAAKAPSELLYVAGGNRYERHPSILAFNGSDKSQNPQPLYSIPPRGGGEYGVLAADAQDDLYVINGFPNGAELDVFPAGKKKPDLACLLDVTPGVIAVQGDVLFMATPQYTIEEFKLPLHAGKTCPRPFKTLVDAHAKLRGSFFFGVAADPQGDIFDIWQSAEGQGYQHIDKFAVGSKVARPYASLGESAGFYLASDGKGDLATDESSTDSGYGGKIALFRYDSKQAKFYDPIPNGMYLGFAFGNHDTQLFAAKDYPSTVVQLYAYDPASQHVGKLLRTFSFGVWYSAQSIAVYSHN